MTPHLHDASPAPNPAHGQLGHMCLPDCPGRLTAPPWADAPPPSPFTVTAHGHSQHLCGPNCLYYQGEQAAEYLTAGLPDDQLTAVAARHGWTAGIPHGQAGHLCTAGQCGQHAVRTAVEQAIAAGQQVVVDDVKAPGRYVAMGPAYAARPAWWRRAWARLRHGHPVELASTPWHGWEQLGATTDVPDAYRKDTAGE